MAERFRILDADTHVVEPAELWGKYLEPSFRARAPTFRRAPGDAGRSWEADTALRARIHLACVRAGLDPDAVELALERADMGLHTLEVDGELLLGPVAQRVWRRLALMGLPYHVPLLLSGFDPDSYVKALGGMEVERAYLYPTTGLCLFAMDEMDPPLAAALVRAYNDWLHDFCARDPGRLRGVGAICRHDPEAMVQELERAASRGWTAVTLRPNPVRDRTLSDPAYERFWSRCEELNIAVGFHEGSHARVPTAGSDRFQTRFAIHACSHPLEQMMGLLALIEGGVLERHPTLRVGFLEAGCSWLPYWLWRLDTEYANTAWEIPDRVRMKPSDYFRRQCFIACEAGEPGLEGVIAAVGEDCVIYGSDFPHVDRAPRIREDAATLAERLSPRVARKILWDNACRFYEGKA